MGDFYVYTYVLNIHLYLLQINFSPSPDLRFDLGLCPEEEAFRAARRGKVMEGLNRLLGKDRGPKTEDEVRERGGLSWDELPCMPGEQDYEKSQIDLFVFFIDFPKRESRNKSPGRHLRLNNK